MSEEKGGVGWFLFGFVLGGLAGAAVAMAYTPESGDEVRERMREKSIELADLARERWGEFSEQARTQIDHVREQVEQGVKSAQEYAADVSEEIGTAEPASEEESATA
jgi:gas vesicle protein